MKTKQILYFLNNKLFIPMGIPEVTKNDIAEKSKDSMYTDLRFDVVTNVELLNLWNIENLQIDVSINKKSKFIFVSINLFEEDFSVNKTYKFSDVEEYLNGN